MTRLAVVACVFALCVAATGSLVGPVAAGDNVALFDFDPQETDVSAGESVTVNATMYTHGGYSGEGVTTVALTVAYDPSVMTVKDVERGPWLAPDDEATVNVTTTDDDEAGRLTVEQTREADHGVTGSGTVVQLTFEIHEDAPSSNVYLQYEDAEVLLETDFPQNPIFREATLFVDGGGDERVPLADEDDDGGTDGVTLAPDDHRGDGDETTTADDASTDVEPAAVDDSETDVSSTGGTVTDAAGGGLAGNVAIVILALFGALAAVRTHSE